MTNQIVSYKMNNISYTKRHIKGQQNTRGHEFFGQHGRFSMVQPRVNHDGTRRHDLHHHGKNSARQIRFKCSSQTIVAKRIKKNKQRDG